MILDIAEYLGIIAFSISGYYIGKRANLDLLGIYIVSFLTALGGGIIRDVMVGRAPVTMTDSIPALLAISTTTLLMFLKSQREGRLLDKLTFVAIDAIGMSSFAISGAMVAIEYQFNLVGVVVMAFLTAVGGGVLRDMLINQIPYLLKGGFYGIIAISIGMVIYTLNILDILNTVSISILFSISALLRLYAYKRDWHLPR